jgi:hypothetical protein
MLATLPGFRSCWPEFPVCFVHFSDSGIDAGSGLESVTPQFVKSGSVVHQHRSRIGCRSSVHHSLAEGSLHARFRYSFSEFAACLGLRVNGNGSPDRGILWCCGACRRRMDDVGFRTLDSSAARDAKPGARQDERHSDHDLAGGDGAWGNDVGPGSLIGGASYTLVGAAGLFLTSLLLARRLSINFAGNLEERVSGVLARTAELNR